MQKIGFIYTNGRKERLPLIQDKKAPADFLYGYLEFKRKGYDVDIIEEEDIPSLSNGGKIFAYFLQKLLRLFGTSIINISLAFRLNHPDVLYRLNKLDAIVATTNAYGFSLGILKLFGKLKTRILFLSMGAFSPTQNLIKKYLYKKLLRVLIVVPESQNETFYLRKTFPNIADKVIYCPFGIDPTFWFPEKSSNMTSKSYILSIGHTNRDYPTLIKTWKPEYPLLKIVTKIKIKNPLLQNIQIIKGDPRLQIFSDIQIREFIQKSFFVIIPLKEEANKSGGQSVCLETMSCGKPVIISKTSGLWDEEIMRDGENYLLVKPHSISELQERIEMLLNNPTLLEKIGKNARETIIEHFTIEHLANRLEIILRTF